MALKRPEINLIIIRNDNLVGSVIPQYIEGVNDFQLTTKSSVREFPTASFKSQNPQINQLFMSFSKNDILKINMKKDEIEEYIPLYEGIFYKKNINFQKEANNLTIEIEAIHSFYKLSLVNLAGIKKYEKITFIEFIVNLMDLANIKSKLYIADDIKNQLIHGLSQNVNAFRLLKDICFQKKLSISFNRDDSVTIENAEEKKKKILGQGPVVVISDKEIISSEHTEKI